MVNFKCQYCGKRMCFRGECVIVCDCEGAMQARYEADANKQAWKLKCEEAIEAQRKERRKRLKIGN